MNRPRLFLGKLLLLLACLTVAQSSLAEDKDFRPGALNMEVPVITSAKELDAHVGRLVAVRGMVSERTKIPYIIGVEVGADDEIRGKEAYAVGILGRFEQTKRTPMVASRGPGVHYTLYFDLRGKIAEAKPMPR